MAKQDEEKAGGEAPKADAPPAQTGQAGGQPPQQQRVEVDESKAIACYTNFCRVTGTPEEVLLDFGLNSQPFGTPTQPIEISQRIVMNYYSAKRMLGALHMTIQRHEAAFGTLETDVQKRVQPGATGGGRPQQG